MLTHTRLLILGVAAWGLLGCGAAPCGDDVVQSSLFQTSEILSCELGPADVKGAIVLGYPDGRYIGARADNGSSFTYVAPCSGGRQATFRVRIDAPSASPLSRVDGRGDDTEVPRRRSLSTTQPHRRKNHRGWRWRKNRTRFPTQAPTRGPVSESIAVYLSPQLVAKVGISQAEDYALLSVLHTNLVFRNSDIPVRLVLVDTIVAPFNESGDSSVDIARVRSLGSPPSGADLSILLTLNMDSCGRSYLDCSRYAYGMNCMFAVVRAACSIGQFAFAHAIGHIHGADHDEPSRSESRFPDSAGYVLGGYRTVMALGSSGETRIPYFSNPDVNFQGMATGKDGTANNARVISYTSGYIAGVSVA